MCKRNAVEALLLDHSSVAYKAIRVVGQQGWDDSPKVYYEDGDGSVLGDSGEEEESSQNGDNSEDKQHEDNEDDGNE